MLHVKPLSKPAPQTRCSTHHAWRHPDCVSNVVWMLVNSKRHTMLWSVAHCYSFDC
jgi:hypothetical protein